LNNLFTNWSYLIRFLRPRPYASYKDLSNVKLSWTTFRSFTMTTNSGSLFKFIDIGSNLSDPMYRGIYNGTQKHEPDLEIVLQRAKENHVEKIMVTGTSLEDSESSINLAKTNPMLYATVGVHPTRCLEFENYENEGEQLISTLLQLIRDENDHAKDGGKVVAIGEIGLDYDRLNFCPKDIQLKYFEKQLDLVESTKLPLFLHNRAAANDLYDILKRNNDRLYGGVVHSFDGTMEEANLFLSLGFYIGLNGCSLKTEDNLKVVKELPADKIMIETDAPWCEIKATHASNKFIKTTFPSKKKEKHDISCHVKGRNEPANIVQVFEVVAGVRGLSSEEELVSFANQIYENTEKVFF